MNYEPPCISEEEDMLLDYMEDIREEALKKLTILEVAALMRDFKEFQVRWREEKASEYPGQE